MIKLKITFYGIMKGKEVMEWNVTPENCKAVSDTIRYLTATDMKRVVNIEMTEAPKS